MTTERKFNRPYIAGPMSFRSDSDWNFPAFHQAASRLRALGYDALNPAESFGGDTSHPYAMYMRRDFELLLTADAIVTLPGWRLSTGANREVEFARWIDIPHYELSDIIHV